MWYQWDTSAQHFPPPIHCVLGLGYRDSRNNTLAYHWVQNQIALALTGKVWNLFLTGHAEGTGEG
jgi:hypothetical protein